MISKKKLVPVTLAILIFTAMSALAQTTRVYVAASGSDANLCTQAAQCRTISKALASVDDGGEVIITESGDYDKFSVSKSVTVAAAPGVDAGIVSPISAAIVIGQEAPVDAVTIRNLNIKNISLQGQGNSQGIYDINAANLYVDGCTFTGFTAGVLTNGTKVGKISVRDSTFRKNVSGITASALLAEGSFTILIDNCKFEHGSIGVQISNKNYASIRNSIMSDNSGYGILVNTEKTQRAEAVIDNCLMTGNSTGLEVAGNGLSKARLSRSTITQNTAEGIYLSASATVYSFQNNVINGNFSDVVGNLTPVSLK